MLLYVLTELQIKSLNWEIRRVVAISSPWHSLSFLQILNSQYWRKVKASFNRSRTMHCIVVKQFIYSFLLQSHPKFPSFFKCLFKIKLSNIHNSQLFPQKLKRSVTLSVLGKINSNPWSEGKGSEGKSNIRPLVSQIPRSFPATGYWQDLYWLRGAAIIVQPLSCQAPCFHCTMEQDTFLTAGTLKWDSNQELNSKFPVFQLIVCMPNGALLSVHKSSLLWHCSIYRLSRLGHFEWRITFY